MSMVVKGNRVETDKEGYLVNLSDWNTDIAVAIAKNVNIELLNPHWEIINLLQNFYREYELSPPMRALIKYIGHHLDLEKANSIYLMKLFPPSPAKIASKIAGLPRPNNCL